MKECTISRSIDTVTTIFGHFVTILGDRRWLDGKKSPDTRLVAVFHSHVDVLSQEEIPKQFCEKESNIRCIITTVAFGMGISIPDISYIIHWGPPQDVLTYWQEVGRCARDGREGKAIMYTPPYSMDNRRVDQSMLNIIKNANTNCIRQNILLTFKVGGMTETDIKACCFHERCCTFCTEQKSK